jgi:tRNA pseudouridine38-40 synthase
MRNIRLQISYDGSAFFGWQRQDGFVTVQETIEDAFVQLTGEQVTVQGSGRTDTGVHALRQVANFHIQTSLKDDKIRHAINAHLPPSVVVNRVETCADDFHARFSAVGKRYVYVVSTRRFKPPHAERQAAWCPQPLDFDAIKEAAGALIGRHDFKGLSSTGSNPTSTIRHVRRLRWIARRDGLAFMIEAEGFLYNMVRAIAGTLVDVGRGRLPKECIRDVLISGDRNSAGATAPAGGLYLVRVLYDERTFAGADPGPRGTPGVF